MFKRIPPVIVLALFLAFDSAPAQDKPKDPDSKYGMSLKARKPGEESFGKDIKRYGVEVYAEGNTGDGIYISEVGAVAVVPTKLFKAGDGKTAKEPLFDHGLLVNARPAGEKEWDKAKRFALEIFRDENNGNLVYISEAGNVAAVAAKYAGDPTPKGKPKNPKWLYGMELKARKAGEKDFTKDTKKYAIEVFRDENNGNLIYVTEGGAIAVAGTKTGTKEDAGKGVDWQHGFELAVRKAGEAEFTKDTKKYSVEVFLDQSSGNLVYIGETGTIAVAPGKFTKPTEGKPKGPEFKYAMELGVRKPEEKEFTKTTKKFGVEIYADENNGNMVYITETGDLAVSTKAE